LYISKGYPCTIEQDDRTPHVVKIEGLSGPVQDRVITFAMQFAGAGYRRGRASSLDLLRLPDGMIDVIREYLKRERKELPVFGDMGTVVLHEKIVDMEIPNVATFDKDTKRVTFHPAGDTDRIVVYRLGAMIVDSFDGDNTATSATIRTYNGAVRTIRLECPVQTFVDFLSQLDAFRRGVGDHDDD